MLKIHTNVTKYMLVDDCDWAHALKKRSLVALSNLSSEVSLCCNSNHLYSDQTDSKHRRADSSEARSRGTQLDEHITTDCESDLQCCSSESDL